MREKVSRCEDKKMWRWADVNMSRCEDEQMWRWADVKMRRWEGVKMSRCEDEQMWRWAGVNIRRCEDEQMWRWADVKMNRCEDEKMSRCEDEQMWRWADVKMRRCEDKKMWRWADVKMSRCEDEQMWWEGVKMSRCEDGKVWRWADVKMRGCEDERMWRWADVKMRGCEDEMWRWEDVLQTPTIGRTLRSDALGKKWFLKLGFICCTVYPYFCWIPLRWFGLQLRGGAQSLPVLCIRLATSSWLEPWGTFAGNPMKHTCVRDLLQAEKIHMEHMESWNLPMCGLLRPRNEGTRILHTASKYHPVTSDEYDQPSKQGGPYQNVRGTL